MRVGAHDGGDATSGDRLFQRIEMFGKVWARLSAAGAEARPSPLRMGAEFGRTLVLVAVFAVLAAATSWPLLGLAALVWAGFPVVILAGSVLHERVPLRLAALHAGDWLVKIAVVAVVLEFAR